MKRSSTTKKGFVFGIASVLLGVSLLFLAGCSKSVAGTWYQESGYSATLEIAEGSFVLQCDGSTIEEGDARIEGDVCYLILDDGVEFKYGLSSDGKTLTCSTRSGLIIAGTWYASEADAASHPRDYY